MSVYLLGALNDKFLTIDNLVKRHVHVDDRFTAYVGMEWRQSAICSLLAHTAPIYGNDQRCRLKLWLPPGPIGGLLEETLNIATTFKTIVKISVWAKLALCISVWHIWHERNRRIFHNERKSKVCIFKSISKGIKITRAQIS